MKRHIFAARLALTAALLAACLYAAHKLEYLSQFGAVDNMSGAAPPLLLAGLAICLAALLWKRHTDAAVSSLVCAITGALLALLLIPALNGNWHPLLKMPENIPPPLDLGAYAPFAPDSRAATLPTQATLSIDEDLPLLDGATALYPVYAAFARAVYAGESRAPETVLCGNTQNAYRRVIAGECDIIFVAGPSEGQRRAAKSAGAELVFTPIGLEAFVFLVGVENPVSGLSYQQLKNVYSGKTAHWRTLGWPEGGEIVALQRPEGSGSQTGLRTIMRGLPIHKPRPLSDASLLGTGSLLRQVSARRQGVQPVIGYSYRYYASAMYANPGARLLPIDGVEPTPENIRDGSYPFVGCFYAVTNGAPQGKARLLIDWILSVQGQALIELTGYVPVK